MVQPIKDPVMSLQQLGLLPWQRFDHWPTCGNFHMRQASSPNPHKKKKKKKGKNNNCKHSVLRAMMKIVQGGLRPQMEVN